MTDAVQQPRQPGQSRLWRDEIVAMLKLAMPLVATSLAQHALTTTDVLMMGWLGPDALAAGALAFNLYFNLAMFGIGVLAATPAMIAYERGRSRYGFAVREVRRTVRQGFWAAITLTIPYWLILWQSESILLLLGQEPALARDAALYMHALQWGLLPYLFYVVLRSFVSAMERPLWSLIVGIVAVVFNAFANWCLMFGNLGFPRLELVGAGIASVAAASIMFGGLALVTLIDRRFRRYALFGRFWRPDWTRYREVWRLGAPVGAIVILETSVFGAVVFLMGIIGKPALAAHSIAIQIAALSFMVPLGISQAATVRVGRAYGAGNADAIRRAGWTAFTLGVGFMACMALVMVTIPHVLVGAFIAPVDAESAQVFALAVSYLLVAALFQIVDGAQAVGAGMLRGLHDTRVPMLYAGLGYWVLGLSSGATLAFWGKLEGVGLWLGLAIGLAIVAGLLLHRWLNRERLGLERR